MHDFEQIGAFYLGRPVAADGSVAPEPLLYDSRDLVTHGICIGMTGSGKTGLCLGLIEEAALDGIPVLAIDPKGDLGNLLLTFPDLRGADFAPWIDGDAARRAGMEPAAFAEREAQRWSAGLAESGQDGERIRRLRAAAEFAIYTPGSNAGIPLSPLSSFAAPPPAVRDDAELLGERVGATAGALLALTGLDADPLTSREHILIAQILAASWSAGRDLDLAGIIAAIQQPPMQRVGVVDLETFYPATERFALAMRLNNLLAAPGFAAWTQGQPIDIGALLHTAAGKPRVAIVSIAHLAERERMFVVTLLLQQLLAWTRTQPGTTSLRALLYVDEIAGYLPPVANPPSKPPLLTLMKQARAFGVGCLLATQNPVDLDYKAIANAGTWFIGRLQTEQDRARVLDGLIGASGQGLDRAQLDRLLAGLGARRFLLHDVHEDAPVVFATRWTMSYLRGPLTREEIRRLRADVDPTAPAPPRQVAPAPPRSGVTPPTLPPTVAQRWLRVRSPRPAGSELHYRPRLAAFAEIVYRDQGRETAKRVAWLADPAAPQPWMEAVALALDIRDLADAAEPGADDWAPPPAGLAAGWRGQAAAVGDAIARRERLEVLVNPSIGLRSRPDEDERNFRIRVALAVRERRDAAVEAARRRSATKIASLEERLRRADAARAREVEQAGQARVQGWLSVGSGILGAMLGRKALSSANVGRAAGAARGAARVLKEGQDVARAEAEVAHWRDELTALRDEAAADAERIAVDAEATGQPLERTVLRPRPGDIAVATVVLAWEPRWIASDGTATLAWT